MVRVAPQFVEKTGTRVSKEANGQRCVPLLQAVAQHGFKQFAQGNVIGCLESKQIGRVCWCLELFAYQINSTKSPHGIWACVGKWLSSHCIQYWSWISCHGNKIRIILWMKFTYFPLVTVDTQISRTRCHRICNSFNSIQMFEVLNLTKYKTDFGKFYW